ncbi:hypothetical protein [Mesorhizobium sp. M0139]|uniref:hypothetical protein n=1 Tax=Mesorhizobium sp. M0139 TaxID=2956892 RepID=UPI00333D70CA
MADIYDQHKAAFANVAAYVIAKDGKRVATIAFKYPKDGAGRLYAYVHWLGAEMVRGHAGGYGYDKHSAAVSDAVKRITPGAHMSSEQAENAGRFAAELIGDNGSYWYSRLEAIGFDVWSAV